MTFHTSKSEISATQSGFSDCQTVKLQTKSDGHTDMPERVGGPDGLDGAHSNTNTNPDGGTETRPRVWVGEVVGRTPTGRVRVRWLNGTSTDLTPDQLYQVSGGYGRGHRLEYSRVRQFR